MLDGLIARTSVFLVQSTLGLPGDCAVAQDVQRDTEAVLGELARAYRRVRIPSGRQSALLEPSGSKAASADFPLDFTCQGNLYRDLAVLVEEAHIPRRHVMAASERSSRDAEFVEFMAAAQPDLLRMARFLTGSDDLARELTQDALVRTYTAWPRVRRDGAVAYTRRIIINRRVNGWRRAAREKPHNPSDARLDTPVADGGGTERRDEVVRLLAALPERQRKVVVSAATTSTSANSR